MRRRKVVGRRVNKKVLEKVLDAVAERMEFEVLGVGVEFSEVFVEIQGHKNTRVLDGIGKAIEVLAKKSIRFVEAFGDNNWAELMFEVPA